MVKYEEIRPIKDLEVRAFRLNSLAQHLTQQFIQTNTDKDPIKKLVIYFKLRYHLGQISSVEMHAQSTIALTVTALFVGQALGGLPLYGYEEYEDKQLSDPCKHPSITVVN